MNIKHKPAQHPFVENNSSDILNVTYPTYGSCVNDAAAPTRTIDDDEDEDYEDDEEEDDEDEDYEDDEEEDDEEEDDEDDEEEDDEDDEEDEDIYNATCISSIPPSSTIHYTTIEELKKYSHLLHDQYFHLRSHSPSFFEDLVSALGKDWGENTPIPLVKILKISGMDDAIWALRADLHPDAKKNIRLFACDYAELILPLFEKEYPSDDSLREAIKVARLFAEGKATEEELEKARNRTNYTLNVVLNNAFEEAYETNPRTTRVDSYKIVGVDAASYATSATCAAVHAPGNDEIIYNPNKDKIFYKHNDKVYKKQKKKLFLKRFGYNPTCNSSEEQKVEKKLLPLQSGGDLIDNSSLPSTLAPAPMPAPMPAPAPTLKINLPNYQQPLPEAVPVYDLLKSASGDLVKQLGIDSKIFFEESKRKTTITWSIRDSNTNKQHQLLCVQTGYHENEFCYTLNNHSRYYTLPDLVVAIEAFLAKPENILLVKSCNYKECN